MADFSGDTVCDDIYKGLLWVMRIVQYLHKALCPCLQSRCARTCACVCLDAHVHAHVYT